jgi:hypothetical protein
MRVIRVENCLSPRSNSVSVGRAVSRSAIFPYSVAIPVFTTTAVALPETTGELMKRDCPLRGSRSPPARA